jgi:hypothetical protein
MPPAAPVEQSRTRPPGGPLAVRSVIDLIGNTPMVELRAVRDGVRRACGSTRSSKASTRAAP